MDFSLFLMGAPLRVGLPPVSFAVFGGVATPFRGLLKSPRSGGRPQAENRKRMPVSALAPARCRQLAYRSCISVRMEYSVEINAGGYSPATPKIG